MSQVELFIKPATLFNAIKRLALEIDFNIVFHKFSDNGGFEVFDYEMDLEKNYLQHQFSKILLTIGSTPESKDDWQFYEKEPQNIIEINGARISSEYLELTSIRVVAKRSRVSKLFNELKSALLENLHSGGLHIGKSNYPEIYYSLDLGDIQLTNNIIDKDFIYSYKKTK